MRKIPVPSRSQVTHSFQFSTPTAFPRGRGCPWGAKRHRGSVTGFTEHPTPTRHVNWAPGSGAQKRKGESAGRAHRGPPTWSGAQETRLILTTRGSSVLESPRKLRISECWAVAPGGIWGEAPASPRGPRRHQPVGAQPCRPCPCSETSCSTCVSH